MILMELNEQTSLQIGSDSSNPIDIYEIYCLWKSLPPFFKNPPIPTKGKDRPTVAEYLDNLGIEDPNIVELSKLQTQKAFAERYGVDEDTLSRWNKTQGVRDSLAEIRGWARQLSKNVLLSLYRKAMKDGMSFEVKLFFQLVEKWEEKAKIEHDYKGVTEIQIIKKVVEEKVKNNDNESTGQQGDEDKMGTDGQTS